jgi:hypothetical protein
MRRNLPLAVMALAPLFGILIVGGHSRQTHLAAQAARR